MRKSTSKIFKERSGRNKEVVRRRNIPVIAVTMLVLLLSCIPLLASGCVPGQKTPTLDIIAQPTQTEIGPDISHYVEGQENCLACHAVSVEWAMPTEDNRPGQDVQRDHTRTEMGRCGECHKEADDIAAYIPLEGDTKHVPTNELYMNCLGCHDAIEGPKPVPQSHLGRENSWCTICHRIAWEYDDIAETGAQAGSAIPHYIVGQGNCIACHGYLSEWPYPEASHNGRKLMECEGCHKQRADLANTLVQVPHEDNFLGRCTDCHSQVDNHQGREDRPDRTNESCLVCHGVAFEPTGQAANMHTSHTSNLTSCVSCHKDATVLGQSWAPRGHGSIRDAAEGSLCQQCHSAVEGITDHPATPHLDGLTGCSDCHDQQPQYTGAPESLIKYLSYHNPGLDDNLCGACHEIVSDYVNKGTIPHDGLTGCSECHDQVEPINHPDYQDFHSGLDDEACNKCHDTAASFAADSPAPHQQGLVGCRSCHDKGSTQGLPQLGQYGAFHSLAEDDTCGACHEPHPSYVTEGVIPHSDLAGCSQCHDQVDPINAPNYYDFHSGLDDEACNKCHDTAASFAADSPAPHQQGLVGCRSCHDKGSTQGLPQLGQYGTFHSLAGDDTCGACHEPHPSYVTEGIIPHSGLAGCSQCHDQVDPINAPNYYDFHSGLADEACDKCHNTSAGYAAVSEVPHSTLTGCATCHNQVTPINATQFQDFHELADDNACIACHDDTGQQYAVAADLGVPHSGLAGCKTCHDQVQEPLAPRYQDFHANTTDNACAACHDDQPNTIAESGVPHSGLAGCRTCHDQVQAPLAPQYQNFHTNTNDGTCATCHDDQPDTIAESGVPHSGLTGCKACHDQVQAPLAPQYQDFHANTADGTCAACHDDTPGLAAESRAPHVEGLDVLVGCRTCHDQVETQWTPQYQGFHGTTTDNDCITCHGSEVDYTESQTPSMHQPTLTDCSGTCHTRVESLNMPGFHTSLLNDDSTCAHCHQKSTAPSTLVKIPASHRTTTSGCTDCHSGLSPYAPNPYDSNPFHVGIPDSDCEDCHERAV